jgi:DNA-binding beta-propeller fold protein YncE
VAPDGTIGAARGVPAGGKAAVTAGGGDQVIAVPFSADVSKCAATASPTGALTTPLTVAIGSDGKSVVVTEPGAPSAMGFHLQVTC